MTRDPYADIRTRRVDIRKPHPAVDTRTPAQRELDRMREMLEALPPDRRTEWFAAADIEDPLLPEPPRPDWADRQESDDDHDDV